MSARATVIIPTFSDARFAVWAIKSVQQQSVKDIEICIICDGSPSEMAAFFKDMTKEDSRISVFVYPKSPRTGEPYRDEAIKNTTGNIVCYCCHDDLWFPNHIETMEKALEFFDFTHTYNATVKNPKTIKNQHKFLASVLFADLNKKKFIKRMLNNDNYFGLSFAAHTRKAYCKLKEGWVTTPDKNIPTDLYMWKKFISASDITCGTIKKVTALTFPFPLRRDLTETERNEELMSYFDNINNPAFVRQINRFLSMRIRMKYREFKRMLLKVPFIMRVWQAYKTKIQKKLECEAVKSSDENRN